MLKKASEKTASKKAEKRGKAGKKRTGRNGRFGRFIAALQAQYRTNKVVFAVYFVLRFLVLALLVLACIGGDWDSVFICLLVLALFLAPAFVQLNFSVTFPSALEIIIMAFIFAAEILGELSNYYVTYPYWDTILHTIWGFLCAAAGFSLVDLLNRSERVKFELSPFYLAVVAFCFSMTVGVLWEFFEFSMDCWFGKDMQKDTIIHAFNTVMLDPAGGTHPVRIEDITDVAVNGESLGLGGYLDIGLYDTMQDLFVNFIGALVFSVVGYIDARRGEGGLITRALVPRRNRAREAERADARRRLRLAAAAAMDARSEASGSEPDSAPAEPQSTAVPDEHAK